MESGVSSCSAGMECSSASAAIASLACWRRRAATGSRSAQARAVGGPSVRGARVGSSSSGSSATSRSVATQRLE